MSEANIINEIFEIYLCPWSQHNIERAKSVYQLVFSDTIGVDLLTSSLTEF